MLAEAGTVYTDEQKRGPAITVDEARAAYRRAFSEMQEDDLQIRSHSTTKPTEKRDVWATVDAESYLTWFHALNSLADVNQALESFTESGRIYLSSHGQITGHGGSGSMLVPEGRDRIGPTTRIGQITGHGRRGSIVVLDACRVGLGQFVPLPTAVWQGSGKLEAGFADPLREYDDAAFASFVARGKAALAISGEMSELTVDAQQEGIAVGPASLTAFREFVRRYQPTSVPALAILDNGNIRAMWKRANGEQVGLQFRAEGDIQFVSFVLRGGQLVSYAGRDTTEKVVERLKADGLIDLVTG